MSVRVFAPAKINLTLEVGRPRADGRHPLQSVVAFADIGDVVEASPAGALSLSIAGPFAAGLAGNDSNLAMAAARALAKSAGLLARGAALALHKNLPVASGMGGGSADAAAALHALNQLWELEYDVARLCEVARGLGADVPVCVSAGPAYITGAGEDFTAIELPSFDAVLVNPLQPLSTAKVYRQFDAMALGGDFSSKPAPTWRDKEACLAGIAAAGNDLVAPAHALMPELGQIRALLSAQESVRHIGLSGSGATMFALVDTPAAARWIATGLKRARPDWWTVATRLGALDARAPRL